MWGSREGKGGKEARGMEEGIKKNRGTESANFGGVDKQIEGRDMCTTSLTPKTLCTHSHSPRLQPDKKHSATIPKLLSAENLPF